MEENAKEEESGVEVYGEEYYKRVEKAKEQARRIK